MNPRGNLFISEGSLLGSSHRVEALLGQGCFGVVAKCHDINTKQCVAIKVNKPCPDVFHQAREEISILRKLRCLDPETSNMVRWNGFFFHGPNICLNFELLDLSLYDYMWSREDPRLPLTEVRSVLNQMSSALCHLSNMGIVHADIKPDNVMVVDRQKKPLQVKLIDFGLARPVSKCLPGVCVQTIWYRAPEVSLYSHFNQAIDMWALGLLAVEMVAGQPMYPGNSEYDVWKYIIETQGQPEDHVLDKAEGASYYFMPQSDGSRRWRFKTPEEFGYMPQETRYYTLTGLESLEEMMEVQRGHHSDHRLLVDLIKRMLSLDQEQRIKPLEVLQHPFLCESPPQSSCPDATTDIPDLEEVMFEDDQTAGAEDTIHSTEKQLDTDISAQIGTSFPDEEPEGQRSQEEIQPASRKKSWFRRVLKRIRVRFHRMFKRPQFQV